MDKIIGVCGFISTGSSSVSDFLKEFDENIVFDDIEFDFTYIPDSIEDLAYHLHEGSSKTESGIVAIKRFEKMYNIKYLDKLEYATNNKFRVLTEKYINDIVQVEWYGRHHIDYIIHPFSKIFKVQRVFETYLMKIMLKLESILDKQINKYPLHKYRLSICPENFYIITKEYINNILIAIGKERGKNLVLDQPFAGNNPQKSFAFFDNPKAIVVDRDPRDHYLFGKKFLRSKIKPYFPTNNVKDYVKFYRCLRESMPYKAPNQNILNIRFEDMIYEYERTSEMIINFLELGNHTKRKGIFDPMISINNTQLADVYPEYRDDILYIEKELGKYLYPFENYKGMKKGHGKMFLGKSPLNFK